jgi:hypothetical protein
MSLKATSRSGTACHEQIIVFNPRFKTLHNDRYASLGPINVRCKSLG